MDSKIIVLYYVSSMAGLVMVIGGIWLIYKQKIYIDRESKQITEIETPIGKFRTNIPALALFVLGFFPLIYPIYESSSIIRLEKVKVVGKVKASVHPVLVYAVMLSEPLQEDREFSMQLPIMYTKDREYKIIYIAGTTILEDRLDMSQVKDGIVNLREKDIAIPQGQEFETVETSTQSEWGGGFK
jgi:hypothetical protein